LAEVDATITETLWASDAVTAYQLYTIEGGGDPRAGVARVAALAKDVFGVTEGVLDHPPAFMETSLGVSEDNYITADEISRALAQIATGKGLPAGVGEALLDRMTKVKPGLNYLTAYGNGGTTSHKNGFLAASDGWVDNDTGLVRFEVDGEERAYAIVFLSEGVQQKYADVPLGQQLMQLAWAHFG
jgi:hypothetical protein